jgi:AraC-like DNA-binding protein
MENAKQQLETTFLSVKVIARQVGINNLSHFAQDFKTAYGHTPAQHRVSFHIALSAR